MGARLRRAIAASAAVPLVWFGLTACGTAVVENNFEVVIEDPGHVLPAGPVEVSVFDSYQGQSDEWARKTMGTATATVPYTTSFESATTKVVGDRGPATNVTAGIAIPAYQPKGYFALDLMPVDGETTTVRAPFVGYYDAPASLKVPPLSLRVTSQEGELQWQIKIAVQIPTTR